MIDSCNINRSLVLERSGLLYIVDAYFDFTLGKNVGDLVFIESEIEYRNLVIPNQVKQTFRTGRIRYDFV